MTKIIIDPEARARCESAAELVAEALEAPPAPALSQWAAIAPALAGRRRARMIGRWSRRLAGPALAFGASAVWLLLSAGHPLLTYVTEGCQTAPGGGAVTTAPDGSGRLIFSDGSRIVLGGGSRGRVVLPRRPSSAEFVLDAGAADLEVVHHHDTRWAVKAGPFRVEVKGTQFHVSWAPRQGRFRLEMRHGEVAVSGGSFPASLVLRSGKVLEVSDGKLSVRDAAAATSGDAPRRAGSDSMSARAAIRMRSATETGAASEKDDNMTKNQPNRIKRSTQLAAAASVIGAVGLLATPSFAAPPAGRGSPVFIGGDGKLDGPMNGYAWVAAGREATIAAPSPCNTQGCFKDTHGQLCTRGSVPALQCTGQGTAQFSCNWAEDWGAVIGMNTTSNRGPWLATAPSSISLAYHGGRGSYRLNAHVAGDPDSKVYCVDGYQSGQVVAAGMLKTACWSDSGDALGDLQQVDQISLEITAAESPISYDYCVTAIAVNGAAGQATDGGHVVIEDNGKLAGQMTGYAWVAGGVGTTFSTPHPCDEHGCFSNTQGQLCAKGAVAPLVCAGQGTPQLSCDWDTNWGGMIGLNANLARGDWGANAPSTVAVVFSGQPASYRLMAHVTGDPDSQSYCIDGYESGQTVQPSQLRTNCWSDSGARLSTFQNVDKIGLQIMSAQAEVPIDVCISDVVVH